MGTAIATILAVLAVFLAYRRYRKVIVHKRADRIDAFRFPDRIRRKVIERYPHLRDEDAGRVIAGLREYFHVCNAAGRRMVSMPSQVVDVAWHEFILFTRNYERFCAKALGRFLHHTPAEAMVAPAVAQDGIRTAWRIACHREGIDPKLPHKLPLLFALDSELAIPDGFTFHLNCDPQRNDGYCAGHIGCGSGCGGGGCMGGSGDAGCGGGCGGGD